MPLTLPKAGIVIALFIAYVQALANIYVYCRIAGRGITHLLIAKIVLREVLSDDRNV